jgi:ribonucleoside-triphosphate reductase (thioredoxin)
MSSFSFKLPVEFIEKYQTKPVDWGFQDAGGNSLGEITFLRTYSRLKEDGTKEQWWEVCQRVIEGMFSIQKDHCRAARLPWRSDKAQRTAQDAYDRMFNFKWLPPGRGLWMMGTPLVMDHRNSAALQNCAFISTEDITKTDPASPFTFLMEASMLGIGVGFDTLGAKKHLKIYSPASIGEDGQEPEIYVVPDTREGWVESVKKLLESYLIADRRFLCIDVSQVRPAGLPIKTFGGMSSGPAPLVRLHKKLHELFGDRLCSDNPELDVELVADIGNLLGVCVVSGNVRRSAELMLGELGDEVFQGLKNADLFPARNKYSDNPEESGWGWVSNNSVIAEVGDDLSGITEAIALNGEPGVVWMDVSRKYGRLIDPPNNKDHRAKGYNPCAEQTLESGECCTLVELFMNRHTDLKDFQQTAKIAFLYAKTVTLMPTHWEKTNAIMQRNRRIGCSVSGVADFTDERGMTELRTWLNETYATVQYYDEVYSEWLCVRTSIKTTTVKPSGTVSILAGASPGAHWGPGGTYFNRAVRFAADDPMVFLFRQAGYRVEDSVSDPGTTVVVYFPIKSQARRSQQDVSLFEKANLAVLLQRYWSNNSVSVTLTFDPETEKNHVGIILKMYEGALKTVSFLPTGNMTYPQMPYTSISGLEFEEAEFKLLPVDLNSIYQGLGLEAVGEQFCSTDACLIKDAQLNASQA